MVTFSQRQPLQKQVNDSGGKAATVPLTVYKNLAAELQRSRLAVTQLQQGQQDLVAQNHRLHQEIERLTQSVLQLHQLSTNLQAKPITLPDLGAAPRSATVNLYTEMQDPGQDLPHLSRSDQQLGWGKLTVIVLLVVIGGFCVGFFSVLLFPNNAEAPRTKPSGP